MSENSNLTFDQLIELKQSTFVELTRWCLDDLVAAAENSSSEIAQKAAAVLKAWDRHADADSRGVVLFAAWAAAYLRPLGFGALAIPFDLNDPLNTPRGLADPAAAVAALEQTAQQLELLRVLGGGMDVAYGDLFRIRYAGYDLPASGGDDLLGTFRTLTFTQDRDLRFRPVAGESYIAVIEFGDTVHARVLLAYGNATQPDSPHFGDQIPLFAAKELREVWRTPAEIMPHLELRETLSR
jgi:acyl-homoserine-lactone acylase